MRYELTSSASADKQIRKVLADHQITISRYLALVDEVECRINEDNSLISYIRGGEWQFTIRQDDIPGTIWFLFEKLETESNTGCLSILEIGIKSDLKLPTQSTPS